MNHPAHEQPFNKTAEDLRRKDSYPLPGIMNLSGEHLEVAEQERQLEEEKENGHTAELVVAGGVTAAEEKMKRLIPETSAPKADGPTYREELETNDDGTPNVNFPKE